MNVFILSNRTQIFDENITHLFTGLMTLVIILTIAGMALIVLEHLIRLHLRRISIGYHPNLSLIFVNLATDYLVFSPSVIVIINEICDWSNQDPIEKSPTFHIANICRSFYVFVGGFSLPGIAAERMFATIYVEDYEANPRFHISILIIVFINLSALIATFAFIYDWCPVLVILIIVGITNATALISFLYCVKRNISYYEDNKCIGSCKRYSLSQRFQVVENIRVARIIKKIFIFSWSCNALLVALFVLSLLIGRSMFSNIVVVLFDLVIATYAILIQVINYSGNKVFQKELKTLLQTCFNFPCFSPKIEPSGPRVRTVFGVELICETQDETNRHFDQLYKTWNS